ncbi:hypothetical protein GN956_G10029 [Arapaima gigas]
MTQLGVRVQAAPAFSQSCQHANGLEVHNLPACVYFLTDGTRRQNTTEVGSSPLSASGISSTVSPESCSKAPNG